MHPSVLSKVAWATVRRLTAAGLLDGWVLAGGTGLALHLGHRESEDLDFFTEEPFDPQVLAGELSAQGSLSIQTRSRATLHAVLDGTRLSFLGLDAPLLFPGEVYRGITVADPRDIAVMKVIAVGGRGSRKDFVDLCFYLRSAGDLAAVLALLRRRFENIDHNEYHLLKSLVYFEDAETEPMPRMRRSVTWESVKETLVAEVRRLSPR
ncbi:MAG: nucleotidyl transferase AbiEii/AbiGii toxin family protein [Planctomycetota bacterium]